MAVVEEESDFIVSIGMGLEGHPTILSKPGRFRPCFGQPGGGFDRNWPDLREARPVFVHTARAAGATLRSAARSKQKRKCVAGSAPLQFPPRPHTLQVLGIAQAQPDAADALASHEVGLAAAAQGLLTHQ